MVWFIHLKVYVFFGVVIVLFPVYNSFGLNGSVPKTTDLLAQYGPPSCPFFKGCFSTHDHLVMWSTPDAVHKMLRYMLISLQYRVIFYSKQSYVVHVYVDKTIYIVYVGFE